MELEGVVQNGVIVPDARVLAEGTRVRIEPLADEQLAKQELASIMPSGPKLLQLAAKNPPLPEWFDEEEEAPF
jgi:hypothetical protein